MKRLFGIGILAIGFLISTSHGAFAFLGDFDPKFSKRPFVAWTVNGAEYKATPLDIARPREIRTDDAGNTLSRYEIRRVRNDGESFITSEIYTNRELTAQESSREKVVNIYHKSNDGAVVAIERTSIWKNVAVTPMFASCDPNKQEDCYAIETMKILLAVIRDKNDIITSGSMHLVYFTADGKEFSKRQELLVTYPNEKIMRVVFLGHGESWAYPDTWQEYHIEENGIHWKMCRTIFSGECPSIE